MGRREVADLEAKLFEEKRRGCLAFLAGPRKIGEIDYERYEDGGARLKIGLRGARLPDGARSVTILVNDAPVADFEVAGGSGYLRLETSRGDAVPDIAVEDTATVQAAGETIATGRFHRD